MLLAELQLGGYQPSAHFFQQVPGRELELCAATHFDAAWVIYLVSLAERVPGVFPLALLQGVAGIRTCLLRQDPYFNIDAVLPVVRVVVAHGVSVHENAVFHLDALVVV